MDPLGPWATYNPSYTRLTGAAGSYQVTAPTGRGNYGSPLHASPTGNNGLENSAVNGLQSTNTQLLLQTAHSSAALTNREHLGSTTMSAAFGPGSFLTQTSAPYDPVFSTLFSHPDQKPSNYGPSSSSNPPKHSLQLTSVSKQNVLESELTRVRENCKSTRQQNNTYFEQHTAGSPSSSLSSPPSWSHQANAQLPSPFGILPHETVGNGMEKGSSICEGDYNVQFTSNQNLSNMSSQLSPALEYSKPTGDYKKIQIRKPDSLLSPGRTGFTPATTTSPSVPFYQLPPTTFSNVGVVSSQNTTSVVCGTNYQNESNKCQQQAGGSDFVSSGKGFVSPVQGPTQYRQPSLDTKLYSEYNSSGHVTPARLSEEHSQSPVNFGTLNSVRQTVKFTRNENSGTCSPNIGSVSVPTNLTVEDQRDRRDLGVTQQTIHRRQLNSDAPFNMQQYSSSLGDNANYGSSPSFPTTETKSYSEPLLCIANDSLKPGQSDCGSIQQTHSPVSTHSHPSPVGHVPSPLSHVPSPLSHVPSPLSHVPSPLSHVQSPLSHVPSPLSHVQSPRGHVPSPIGHNPSPHGHSLSPHAHTSSPAYPVYHSPVGMVPSTPYVQPLSPEVALRQSSAVNERPKIVSHSTNKDMCSAQSVRGLPKSQVPAQHVINCTNSSPGVVHRQKADECDLKDSYTEDSSLHGKGNLLDYGCQKQNVEPQVKEHSITDKSSQNYKIHGSERVGGDSSAASMIAVAQTANASETSTLLPPQDNLEQENYTESSSSQSKQLNNYTATHTSAHDSASLQEGDDHPSTVLLSNDEVTEAHTNEHSSHLVRGTPEEQHLGCAEETGTQNSSKSPVTQTDRNQEKEGIDSGNNSLNEKLHSPEESVGSDSVLKQRSATCQGSKDVSNNEYQSVTASVTQETVTDLSRVHQSSDSNQQVSDIADTSSKKESASRQPSDFSESFNEINRKVTLINIEDDLDYLLADSSVDSPMSPEQDIKIPKQKYFLQNRSGFLDGYMKFLNEERQYSITKSKNIEQSVDKDTRQKLKRKQIAKNADMSGTNTKFSKYSDSACQNQQDDDSEESSYSSDVTSDTSETETTRTKGKRTEWTSRDNSHQEDERSERKRQKLDKEEKPDKRKKKRAKDSQRKSVQRSTIQLRRNSNSNSNSEFSSKCDSFQSNYPSNPQSLDSQNSHEKEQRKRSGNVKDQVIAKRKMSVHKEDQAAHLPRREMTPRRAKQISNTKKYNLEDDSDSEGMDSDPAWTPAAKEPSDDDNVSRRRSRRSRYMLTSCKRARHASPDDTSPGDTEDLEVSKLRGNRTRQNRTRTHSTTVNQHSHSVATADVPSVASNPPVREAIADTNFRSGDFVIMKSDIAMDHPPLWRIDGRTLLQKYESFEQSGKTLYRNISTYTSWTPQNRHIYQQVPVRFVVQNHFETVVELQKNGVGDDHKALAEQSVTETAKYYSSFEVYIQTLISQALDSNFLTEVLREHDDYFLTNLKTVDEVTEERMQHILRIAKWPNTLRTSVGTWPCFNVIDEPTDGDGEGAMSCIACEHSSATARVQMYGQPYDRTTLEGCPPDPKLASQKDFLLCKVCVSRVELYNKVAHQKYHMYVECAKRVADKRSSNPSKDSMEILNELLADELWLRELFLTVRHVWAEIDTLEVRNNVT